MSWVRNLIHDFDGVGITGGSFRLEVPEWEILDEGVTALWGPSGAGKTSLFRILLGLEDVPGYTWEFKGLDLAKLPAPERRLGVVFQTLDLFPHMSARENILFAAEARSIPKADTQTHLQELVATLALGECLERKASVLSGGERQRTALARAVIGRPRVLFLDEPFSALDAELRVEARQLVKRVISAEGIPTVLITHDREDLEALDAKVTRMRSGRIENVNL